MKFFSRKYILLISIIFLILGFYSKYLTETINHKTREIKKFHRKLRENNRVLISKIKLLKNYQKELPDIVERIKQLHTVSSKREVDSLYNKITDYCSYREWKYTKLKNNYNVYSFNIDVEIPSSDVAEVIGELSFLYHLVPEVYFKLNKLVILDKSSKAKLTAYIFFVDKGKK